MRRAATPVRFAGYAALFDIPDGARGVIRPGAFARTLAERQDPVPLYWQHWRMESALLQTLTASVKAAAAAALR